MYRAIPDPVRESAQPAVRVVKRWVNSDYRESESWRRNHYTHFGRSQRESIFLGIARFAHINRPIDGYYFEFGSHEANTMRMAWKHFRHLFNWDFVAFDSFEGLPEIGAIDRQEIWAKGRLATAEETFVDVVTGAGMPRNRLQTVRGFYDRSLTPELAARLKPRNAAVIYVDCDLYESTVPVLAFVRDFIQPGTIIVFDDWNCFLGDPERGERRAWAEFTARHPDLRFVPFMSTAEAQSFIFVG
jgi:O-methyltransferase